MHKIMAEHNLKVYLIHYLKKKQFKLYQPFSQGRANEGERILIPPETKFDAHCI